MPNAYCQATFEGKLYCYKWMVEGESLRVANIIMPCANSLGSYWWGEKLWWQRMWNVTWEKSFNLEPGIWVTPQAYSRWKIWVAILNFKLLHINGCYILQGIQGTPHFMTELSFFESHPWVLIPPLFASKFNHWMI